MTKNALIIGLAAVAIIICLVLAFYMQNKTADLNLIYGARKQDILTQQRQLEQTMTNLNETLQQALIRQQSLSQQLASLENQNSQSPTPSPQVNPTPAPVPAPSPAPVTRAS